MAGPWRITQSLNGQSFSIKAAFIRDGIQVFASLFYGSIIQLPAALDFPYQTTRQYERPRLVFSGSYVRHYGERCR
jgi:hypothetical protein